MNLNHPLLKKVLPHIKQGGSVLDIGPGIKPQNLISGEVTCIEPHKPYVEVLKERGYRVVHSTAIEALRNTNPVDSIVMLDVIEHMEKDAGLECLSLAKKKSKQVVIFTPLGFVPQHGDAWNMGGEVWQEHRSGWEPSEFGGWLIYSDPKFHGKDGAFFAIWHEPVLQP